MRGGATRGARHFDQVAVQAGPVPVVRRDPYRLMEELRAHLLQAYPTARRHLPGHYLLTQRQLPHEHTRYSCVSLQRGWKRGSQGEQFSGPQEKVVRSARNPARYETATKVATRSSFSIYSVYHYLTFAASAAPFRISPPPPLASHSPSRLAKTPPPGPFSSSVPAF